MYLHFTIYGIGFDWRIWTPAFERQELVVFHLALYWRDRWAPKRLWSLSATQEHGLVYRDIRGGQRSNWYLQAPVHWEKYPT